MLFSACTGLQIPDAKLCTVAGGLSAGMDCATTVSGKTESLTLDEAIAFLEPTTDRAGAVCMSTDDFTKLKVLITQACDRLRACTKEVKEELKEVAARVDGLVLKAKERRKKK